MCFLLVISLFKMALKYNAEVLSSVATHEKAVMRSMEKKIHVLRRLYSGMSYNDIGHEVNVNEATVCFK